MDKDPITPKVSIILPTFNRATLLPNALESIKKQFFIHWELIVIDDGSSDETQNVVEAFSNSIRQPVHYIHQHNQGPAVARRKGVSCSNCSYIAFLDSDDRWLPDHLELLFSLMEKNDDVDWICTDMSRIELETGQVVLNSKFSPNGRDIEFFQLENDKRGELHVVSDRRLTRSLIKYGGYGALNCSLIRKRMFDRANFRDFRIGEDRLLAVEASLYKYKLAYIKKITVNFMIHDSHTTVGSSTSAAKVTGVYCELLRMYKFLRLLDDLSLGDRLSVRRKASEECFWNLAYSGLWKNQYLEASLKYQRIGIYMWPFSATYWKTYISCLVRKPFMETKPH